MKMKNLLILCSLAAMIVVGCNTTQQKYAYNSISITETSATSAYQSYIGLVAKGQVPTNNVPKISADFEHFQLATRIAIDLARGNSNTVAPASLVTEAATLKTMIKLSAGTNSITN